ncbi:hypothetical protein CL654_02690 [bacterium]|nr:hypothetical protein [bacterium]|tara:strand:+ start:27849 stop:28259 length:411 start_codon:yes stop_codon:yes gene_type:complete
MAEEIPRNNFEQEISEISKAIEARRDNLEKEIGIVEEKEIAREVIKEKIEETIPSSKSSMLRTPQSTPSTDSSESYLDTLDETNTQKVVSLVEQMREKGIKKAVAEAQENDPYILDAFHDVLVDKLYDELKERGYI